MFLVVDDLLTITSPYYSWKFYNEDTKQEYWTDLVNQTSANPRYDRFDITLPTDLDLPSGRYRYYVYESETANNETPSDDDLLATGVIEVETTFSTDTIYEPTGTDTYYEPEDS